MSKLAKGFIVLTIMAAGVAAQSAPQTIGSTKFRSYTLADISAETRDTFLQLEKDVAKQRNELLESQIGMVLMTSEAKARGITVQDLERSEITSRITDPVDADIRAYYDSHKDEIPQTFEQARPAIGRYLRRKAENEQRRSFIAKLITTHPVVHLKDVNLANLRPDDILASAGDEKITFREFDEANAAAIWGTMADAYEAVIQEVEKAMFTDLLTVEAKQKGLASGASLLKGNGNEPNDADDKLKEELFSKFDAKIFLERPKYIRPIDVAGAPYKGDAKARVSVVMFSDFECSHCALAHPTVESVVGEFGRKVRFIVKNYPLVSIHPNALRAAEAAAAAQEQGKFFEYVELLYKNQDSLGDDQLKKFASDLGLDRRRFDRGLMSGRFASRIRKDIDEGARLGLFGTPTVFVNGSEIYALSARNLRNAIKAALGK